jgi:hypothetical protein
MASELARPLTEVSKGGQCVGLKTLPLSCAISHDIWEPQPLGTLRAYPGLYRDCFTCFTFVCVFVCFHGRPRQATDVLQPTGLLYRPLWTFQFWPPDAPAPTDAVRTLAAEVGTYGRGIGPVILPKCRLPRYI